MALNRNAIFTLQQSISGLISCCKGGVAGTKSPGNGSLPCLLGLRSLIHTIIPGEPQNRMGFGRSLEEPQNRMGFGRSPNEPQDRIAFVKGILEEDGFSRDSFRNVQVAPHIVEDKLDIVHIKLMKNNTFITVTDSNGNKKVGASSGCLEEMKGGPKVSRYAAEATAEHVGRLARNLGLKSVVMRVNGFTHFKKKKQAILSWREGYTYGRGDKNPIAFIEDTTRRAHNGCRLPKKRRV